MNKDEYDSLVEIAQSDDNILGVILGGSRGKHDQTVNSDYDVYVIVRDEAAPKYKQFLSSEVLSFDEFKHNIPAWDKYNFVRLRATIDKTSGKIQEIIDKHGQLSPAEANKIVENNLDKYINFAYRSAKSHRDGKALESRLDAAESIAPMLETLFALEGRVRPYNKYLVWELQGWPLKQLSISSEVLIHSIESVLQTGSIEAQKKIFVAVKALATQKGFAPTIAAWGDELDILEA